METTHIRAAGDREYWDKIATIARLRKTSMGAAVKMACDNFFAEDLEKIDRDVAPLFLPDIIANSHSSYDHSEAQISDV